MYGPQRLLRQRVFRRGDQAGNTEICHLNTAVSQDHNIMRLDIPMDDPTAVRMAKPLHDLRDKMQRLAPVQLSPALRGLGDVYKRQSMYCLSVIPSISSITIYSAEPSWDTS